MVLLGCEGKNDVATYLEITFSKTMSGQHLQDMGIPADSTDAQYQFCSFWSGTFGIYPGSGCGNEPGESLHIVWQRELAALGGKASLLGCLPVMQKLYRDFWRRMFTWDKNC